MKKYLLALALFLIIIFLFTPYLTSNFFDLRQQKENEENYQRFLKEEQAKKDAEEKLYLLGQFDPTEREDFSVVPAMYNVTGYKIYLRKETLDAFEDMAESAEKDEVELNIASATRNFDYQKNIWNKKWEGLTLVEGKDLSKSIIDSFERMNKILEYSAIPGTSRHHWGTDIDIDSAIPEYFNTEKGEKIYSWLIDNASQFGFCQPYTLKGSARPTGYNEEKWHWSYVPLSKKFTQDYKNLITSDDIKGFDGDKYVKNFDLINDYVEDINPQCH